MRCHKRAVNLWNITILIVRVDLWMPYIIYAHAHFDDPDLDARSRWVSKCMLLATKQAINIKLATKSRLFLFLDLCKRINFYYIWLDPLVGFFPSNYCTSHPTPSEWHCWIKSYQISNTNDVKNTHKTPQYSYRVRTVFEGLWKFVENEQPFSRPWKSLTNEQFSGGLWKSLNFDFSCLLTVWQRTKNQNVWATWSPKDASAVRLV